MDLDKQTIIYALDAIECSVRANLKLVTALKALVAPPVYTCDLGPCEGDPELKPHKIFPFDPPAIKEEPVCLQCQRQCFRGNPLKQCPDIEECVETACFDCCHKTSCKRYNKPSQ
jgi:hypothetical protein